MAAPTRQELVALARKALHHCLERGATPHDRYQLAAIKLTIESYDVDAEPIHSEAKSPVKFRSSAELHALAEELRAKRRVIGGSSGSSVA